MSEQLLLCTDLDRTLLPNGSQPESPGARDYFARLVSHPAVTLAYVSGRHRNLVAEAIHHYHLPLPDWVIGDVGTTIYRVNSGEWRYWSEWEQEIAKDWHGLEAKDLLPFISNLTVLDLQEKSKQNRFKLSFYLPLQTDIEAIRIEISRHLGLANLAASLIYSMDDSRSIGLLDVIPALATKLHAVEFLMTHLGFDITNTIFAGDSGNDLAVLASSIPSVIVANADFETIEQAKSQSRQQNTMAALYLAQGGFLGMNGNYCAGLLEGLVHFQPHTLTWMEQNNG